MCGSKLDNDNTDGKAINVAFPSLFKLDLLKTSASGGRRQR
jgi:hypothetical protein